MNLSEKKDKALELKEKDDIIVTNTDKGGAVVILDEKDHEKECKKQLNNTKNYKHLQKDPTATNNKLVYNKTKRFENKNLIQTNITEGLKINSPQTPRIYTQPDIHKKGNPDISSLNCHKSRI